MKICKDGRIWGQNNKEAGDHLGILTKGRYVKTGIRTGSKNQFGSKNPFYGKHHSIEARLRMSEAKMGSKHPKWKGGISPKQQTLRGRIEFRLWREAVFARDNWTCQECGRRGGYMNAHHIKSLAKCPELKFAIDNGKTLCTKCHRLTDNYAGRNTRNGADFN